MWKMGLFTYRNMSQVSDDGSVTIYKQKMSQVSDVGNVTVNKQENEPGVRCGKCDC